LTSSRSASRRRLAGLALAALTGCGTSGSEDSSVSGHAPGTLEVLDKQALAQRLAPSGKEKAVLANFWATWCPPCVEEMPELVELARRWKDRGVRVQTVALDVALPVDEVDTAEEVRAFMVAKGFELPTLVFDGDIYELNEHFGLAGAIPVTLVLDATGKEVGRHEGSGDLERFEALLERALGR
jgi:thiol-disulfide isomerase/thioredoxin